MVLERVTGARKVDFAMEHSDVRMSPDTASKLDGQIGSSYRYGENKTRATTVVHDDKSVRIPKCIIYSNSSRLIHNIIMWCPNIMKEFREPFATYDLNLLQRKATRKNMLRILDVYTS